MSKKLNNIKVVMLAIALALPTLALPSLAVAHCDSLDGPVLVEAKAALKTGDVTPLLKWVPAKDEGVIREAFKKSLALGARGEDVREFAEMYFFETLVRIHRAGEGFAYTGLKATARDSGPAVIGADQALEAGCAHNLTRLVTSEVVEGIKRRFNHTLELKAKAGESVEAGREYVEPTSTTCITLKVCTAQPKGPLRMAGRVGPTTKKLRVAAAATSNTLNGMARGSCFGPSLEASSGRPVKNAAFSPS